RLIFGAADKKQRTIRMVERDEGNESHLASGAVGGLATIIPPIQWLPHYEVSWFKQDAVAGVTLAAYAIPVSLSFSSLGGLPPHYVISCYLVGGLAYALFGTSRQRAIGPTSAIAMLVGTTVAGMAGGDAGRWAAIAALTALVVAVLGGLAWLFRLSG